MPARVGVVVFPGSNCEHDVVKAVRCLGGYAETIWHGSTDLQGVDAVVLPGGFAHGDYLRPGAIARFSPVMTAVGDFAQSGGTVVGICNGFQVLTEAGLLPGALQKNQRLSFICDTVELEVSAVSSVMTSGLEIGSRLALPINHFEGSYLCDEATLAELEASERIILRYVSNPNGSAGDIAGIANQGGNVIGLMPHPERAVDPLTGTMDGRALFQALLDNASTRRPAEAKPEAVSS